ncbi:hypothetical protein FSP39_016506 [Pinctada imbricata]|uniref:Uncharacterized protein n=1 Tax=Pinctada imbricata TaxID=66713 RepID=A0AA88Y5A8_PINIB|nr:hypothetical protein FSP39_016506 [Pinctada imbricata]
MNFPTFKIWYEKEVKGRNKGANHLDHILNGTYYSDIPCPCSQHKCRFYKNGYAIAVALVKKLKVKAGEDKTEKAKKFALSLVREKWRFGECDNNVVILYSADDGVVSVLYWYD